ncbi:hypothetical protein B5864_21290, partial [Salmonella enterica]|nr:hypothetical protein [Salmonella enterica]
RNIILSVILCVLLNYHIICVFPAAQIRKLPVPDLRSLPPRHELCNHNMRHSVSGCYPLCCVNPSLSDPVRRGEKARFVYSLAVVHFRKSLNSQKIGSPENSRQVIYRSGYMAANYLYMKKLQQERLH